MSNGAIYIVKSKLFLNNPNFLQKQTSYYVMDKDSSIDIDDINDLKTANDIMILKNYLF